MPTGVIRGGHNNQSTGTSGLINEVIEDRKVTSSVIKYLRQAGWNITDATPGNMDVNEDLAYGVKIANDLNKKTRVDLFASIHFNSTGGSPELVGSEVVVYSHNDYANRVQNKLVAAGFVGPNNKPRANKINQGLYELSKTAMTAIIIEVCFVNAPGDVALYKKLGSDEVGRLIAEGISGKSISSNGSVSAPSTPAPTPAPPKPSAPTYKKPYVGVNVYNEWVKRLQNELNAQGFRDARGNKLTADGYAGARTCEAAGKTLLKKGAKGNITRLLQEMLNSLGYSTNGIDGDFGNGTHSAVKLFQSNNGLTSDGVAGKGTWTRILGN